MQVPTAEYVNVKISRNFEGWIMVQRYVAARPQRLQIIPQVALMTNLGDTELGENLGPGRSYSIEATFVNAPRKREGAKYVFFCPLSSFGFIKKLI